MNGTQKTTLRPFTEASLRGGVFTGNLPRASFFSEDIQIPAVQEALAAAGRC